MELLNALGLNIKILIAQLINFAVLVLILWKFGYKPILKFLNDRKDKIERGVLDAEKATARLEEISDKEKEIIKKAKKEALIILEKAKKQGDENRKEIIDEAKEEIGQLINQEKAEIQIEKRETLKEIKREVADLVIRAVERIIREKIDNKKDKDLIKKIVKDLK